MDAKFKIGDRIFLAENKNELGIIIDIKLCYFCGGYITNYAILLDGESSVYYYSESKIFPCSLLPEKTDYKTKILELQCRIANLESEVNKLTLQRDSLIRVLGHIK